MSGFGRRLGPVCRASIYHLARKLVWRVNRRSKRMHRRTRSRGGTRL
jgi:hypothetical protein